MRGLVLAAIVVFIGVAVLIAQYQTREPDRPQPGPPDNRPRAVVALGDSTMSGEGAGRYVSGTDGGDGNWCHRSARAAVHSARLPGVDRTINLACSGAPSAQVGLGDAKQYTEPSQAERLREVARKNRIVAVVVAVGANDEPKFSHLVSECVQAWANRHGDACSKAIRHDWDDRVDAMRPKVVGVLEDIRKVMSDAHYRDDDYQLVLQSYASPLSPKIPRNLHGLAGCPFRTEDMRWVRDDAIPVLTETLREAADDADARFLDLSRSARGHEACTGGRDPSSEWLTRLTVQWQDLDDGKRVQHALQESFHPNARGYAQFGRCLADFLNTSDERGACLPGTDGQLRAAAIVGDG
ncbi:MAG: hypothetical protein GEU98_15510 [Pseudonocardiaceae bacterium]|nr:hypothetical protein [Pseudonocardiaceae bacterium]